MFITRKNISLNLYYRATSNIFLNDTFLQITVVHHYIEYNVSAARHLSNIAYPWNIVSIVEFHITYDVREDHGPKVRKTREDKLPNVGTFLRRLDLAAYYCSADSWHRGGEGKRAGQKRGINEKYLAERSVARQRLSLGLHFSTSKLLFRRRSRGTLNVRIEKEVTKRNSVPRRP